MAERSKKLKEPKGDALSRNISERRLSKPMQPFDAPALKVGSNLSAQVRQKVAPADRGIMPFGSAG
jgi:hypothetical protein